MTAKEYLKKAKLICDIYEPDGCNTCPLCPLSCGLPRKTEKQNKALQIVSEFKKPPKPYVCPVCKNADHQSDAKFCKNCGTQVGGK